jgi:hypothetical protein
VLDAWASSQGLVYIATCMFAFLRREVPRHRFNCS